VIYRGDEIARLEVVLGSYWRKKERVFLRYDLELCAEADGRRCETSRS